MYHRPDKSRKVARQPEEAQWESQVHPKVVQVDPKGAQVDPKGAQGYLESAQVNPKGGQVGPKWSHLATKLHV